MILELVGWIDGNIEHIHSLDVVYNRAGYSPGHLRFLFKQSIGISLYKYITIKRMALSLQDLHSGKLTIAAIAAKHHFSSTQSFSRAFKRMHRCTPVIYMKINVLQRSESL